MYTEHYIECKKSFHQIVYPADNKIINAGNKTTAPVVAIVWTTADIIAHRASRSDIFFLLMG